MDGLHYETLAIGRRQGQADSIAPDQTADFSENRPEEAGRRFLHQPFQWQRSTPGSFERLVTPVR